jgi:hypothetical protein
LCNIDVHKLSSKQREAHFAKTTGYPEEMQRCDFVDHACREDKSESSFILFYSSEISFSTGYAVTIIVEGDISTCLAILYDIQMKRPVIVIQGSGKIADVIVSLMELTAKNDYTPVRLFLLKACVILLSSNATITHVNTINQRIISILIMCDILRILDFKRLTIIVSTFLRIY